MLHELTVITNVHLPYVVKGKYIPESNRTCTSAKKSHSTNNQQSPVRNEQNWLNLNGILLDFQTLTDSLGSACV